MTPKLHFAAPLAALLSLFAFRAFADGPPPSEKLPPAAADSKTPAANRVLVTISKETTVITGPLRKDGYPDYVAALNELYGKDVTPENNALVPFWKGLGPEQVEDADRAEYFRMLGMSVPAETGDYFTGLAKFVRQREAGKKHDDEHWFAAEIRQINDEFDTALMRPWSRKEFPIIADWLDANERPLALAIEASSRPQYYEPLVGGPDKPLITVLLPAAIIERDIACALIARGTMLVGEGRTNTAWRNLLAAHRIARLSSRGPSLLHALAAVGTNNICFRADRALLQSGGVTAAEAMRMCDDLLKLAPLAPMVGKVDRMERFAALDCVVVLSRDGKFAQNMPRSKNLRGGTIDAGISPADRKVMRRDLVCRP